MPTFKTAFLTVIMLALIPLAASGVENDVMSVQVKQGKVRSSPSFLGRIVARLSYGDRVAVFEERGSWLKVKVFGRTADGWMHISSLTPKQIVLQAGTRDVEATVSGDELALAGKGFNEQVENRFKAENPKVDFTWIDRMETFVVSEQQMKEFLEAGGLSPQGGL